MAKRMKTSRRQGDRGWDPAIPSVTLDTLRRAARAIGRLGPVICGYAGVSTHAQDLTGRFAN